MKFAEAFENVLKESPEDILKDQPDPIIEEVLSTFLEMSEVAESLTPENNDEPSVL